MTVVSIPSSSGHHINVNGAILLHGVVIKVSIPSSSGHHINAPDPGPEEEEPVESQSLLHQGITSTVVCSDGQRPTRLWSQSLLHQGITSTAEEILVIRCVPKLSQSLLHQGITSTSLHPPVPILVKPGLNPFFIRASHQQTLLLLGMKDPVVSQSLLHQGITSTRGNRS